MKFLQSIRCCRCNPLTIFACFLISGAVAAGADPNIPSPAPITGPSVAGLFTQTCGPSLPTGIGAGIAHEAFCESKQASEDSNAGRNTTAELHYLRSFSLFDQLGDRYRPAAVTVLMNTGSFYRVTHRLAEAEQTLLKALGMEQDLPSGGNAITAMIKSRLADVYSETTDPGRGKALLLGALEEFEKEAKPNNREVAYAYNTLGMIEGRRGPTQAAESYLRKALAVSDEQANPVETAAYQTNLGLILYQEGRYGNAELILNRAVFLLEHTPGQHPRQLATTLTVLATVQSAANEFPAAEHASLRVLPLLDDLQGPHDGEKLLARINLAGIYMRERKVNEAAKSLPSDVAAERQYFTDKRVLGDGLRRLAELRALQKRWEEAVTLYAESVGFLEAALGASHPDVASVLHEYADVLKHAGGRKAEAKNIEARARSIENAAPPA